MLEIKSLVYFPQTFSNFPFFLQRRQLPKTNRISPITLVLVGEMYVRIQLRAWITLTSLGLHRALLTTKNILFYFLRCLRFNSL